MQVLFKSRHSQATDLRDLTERRARFVLRRLGWLVPRVDVQLSDVNGPRGELDKLIERSATMAPAPTANVAARSQSQFAIPVRNPRSQPPFANSDCGHGSGPQGKRKKSWLSNIFD